MRYLGDEFIEKIKEGNFLLPTRKLSEGLTKLRPALILRLAAEHSRPGAYGKRIEEG